MRIDKRTLAENAIKEAVRRVTAAGFGDLFDNGFKVCVLSNQEITSEYGATKWLGRYMPGSVDSPEGLTAEIAYERHGNYYEMVDTLAHESGHALWEMLDEEGRNAWIEQAVGHPLGPLECFADDFTFLTYQPELMRHADLFRAITAVAE